MTARADTEEDENLLWDRPVPVLKEPVFRPQTVGVFLLYLGFRELLVGLPFQCPRSHQMNYYFCVNTTMCKSRVKQDS